MEKTEGKIAKVEMVANSSPPMTARPSGALSSAPVPSARAIGIMPAIMAMLVMSTGLIRVRAPSSAAAAEERPRTRRSSANVTSRIAFATATPIAMMAPMKDCMFKVEPLTRRATITPHRTAGTVEITTKERRRDWKFAASNKKITAAARARPRPRFAKV